jgi:hypothetical protein
MPLLRILAKGQDENSPAAGRAGGSVHDDGALADCDASLGGVTVFILDHPIGSRSLRSRYDPDQYDALRRATSALEASGVTVKPLPTDVARRFTRGESCVSMHLYYSMCLDDNALDALVLQHVLGRQRTWLKWPITACAWMTTHLAEMAYYSMCLDDNALG